MAYKDSYQASSAYKIARRHSQLAHDLTSHTSAILANCDKLRMIVKDIDLKEGGCITLDVISINSILTDINTAIDLSLIHISEPTRPY